MSVRFQWQPAGASSVWRSKRGDLGLALGGDESTIGTSSAGTVKLYEVGGKNDKGVSAKTDRLICTFHGVFHRDDNEPPKNRVTFQLDGVNGDLASGTTNGDFTGHKLRGFDPECVFGCDAIVLWFANRLFQIFLPFYLDSRSESSHMELQAVAEAGGSTIGRSGILKLPIKRRLKVKTTSGHSTKANTFLEYTGGQIGCTILSHTEYLMGVQDKYLTINPGNKAKFGTYKPGDLKIVLHPTLLEPGSGLVPGGQYLQSTFPHQTYPSFFNEIRARIVAQARKSITHLFGDAGFAGVQVLTEADSAGAALISAFDGVFRKRRNLPWTLRPNKTELKLPFWTFHIVAGHQRGMPKWVGLGEDIALLNTGGPWDHGKDGHGNKEVTFPLQVMTSIFRRELEKAVRLKKTPAPIGTWWGRDEFDESTDAMATRFSFIVAHEVSHRLGMMHASILERDGSCTEWMFNKKRGTLTIMSPSSDHQIKSMASVIDVRFSTQAKVIWSKAFGVSPNYSDESLKNKTWTDPKTSWDDRIQKFKEKYGTKTFSRPSIFDYSAKTPSWAGGTKQRGAHFK